MVGEYFDKKGNKMTLTLGPWQSVTILMKNKKNHLIMHDSGTGKPAVNSCVGFWYVFAKRLFFVSKNIPKNCL